MKYIILFAAIFLSSCNSPVSEPVKYKNAKFAIASVVVENRYRYTYTTVVTSTGRVLGIHPDSVGFYNSIKGQEKCFTYTTNRINNELIGVCE